MEIEEIKEKYPDEWILVEALEWDEDYNILDARVLEHSEDRSDTYAAMRVHKDVKYTYHFYNGRIPKEGYILML